MHGCFFGKHTSSEHCKRWNRNLVGKERLIMEPHLAEVLRVA
jgi:hypothetical protein